MSLAVVAALSLAETVAVVRRDDILSPTSLVILLALVVAQYVVVKLYDIFVWPFYVSPLRHLPTPKNNTPFLGQMVNQIRNSSPNGLFVSWSKQWPDAPFIRYLNFANSEVLLVNSISAHKQVLQSKCYDFEKSDFFRNLVQDIAGKGLLFSTGEEHKSQRRQLIGPFSPPNIRKLYPVFRTKATELVAALREDAEKGSDEGKGVFDPEHSFVKITLDAIVRAALGVETGDVPTKGYKKSFFENYHYIFNGPPINILASVINAHVPIRWLPLTVTRGPIQAANELHEMLREVVRERTRQMHAEGGDRKVGNETSKDVLTLMLEAINSGEANWTEDQVIDHIYQFLSAGHETVSTALVLSTGMLASRPDCQDSLRAEIQEAERRSPEFDALTVEGLPYLNNFVREVCRLYSMSIMVPRQAVKDVEIDGVFIPKGTSVMICPQVTHESAAIWGDDAAEFKPERWSNLMGDAATPFALETFVNGPRVCPGKGFALLEIKTLLIEMIRHFTIESVRPITEFQNPSLTLKPKGGIRITLKDIR